MNSLILLGIFYILSSLLVVDLLLNYKRGFLTNGSIPKKSKKSICVYGIAFSLINFGVYVYNVYALYEDINASHLAFEHDEFYASTIQLDNYYGEITDEEFYLIANGPDGDFLVSCFFESSVFVPFLILLIYGIIIYFLFPIYMHPTLTAMKNNHQQTTAIAWINYFLGITFIIWLILLIWSNNTLNQVNDYSNSSEKLIQLEKLYKDGIINTEEYENKRKDYISKL